MIEFDEARDLETGKLRESCPMRGVAIAVVLGAAIWGLLGVIAWGVMR